MKETIKKSREEHIILHAQEVFFNKGYSNAAISDICKSADCSRTTLYTYFETKENLYLAVVKRTFNKFLRHFAQLDLEGKKGLDRVLTLAIGYLEFAGSHPQYYQEILNFYGLLRSINEKAVQTETQSKIKNSANFEDAKAFAQLPLKLLASEIQKGQEDGSIQKRTSPQIHMMNIWAYLKGISDLSPIVKNISPSIEGELNLTETVTRMIRTMFQS
ncbi:MAG: TetR/AcrR family transcriptional regulator [Bacteroidota bacterium]